MISIKSKLVWLKHDIELWLKHDIGLWFVNK